MKIIIVDDSVTLRIQLKTKLEEEGYEVIEAEDGVSGIEAIKSNQDALVIIADINMPGMDGLTMLEVVLENQLSPQSEKIVLTTETSEKMKKRGKMAGVAAWFVKPLTPYRLKVLLGLVEKLINKE